MDILLKYVYFIKFSYTISTSDISKITVKKSEVGLVKDAVRYHQMFEYDLNWHSFNIIKSFAYASASVYADENKYKHPSVK